MIGALLILLAGTLPFSFWITVVVEWSYIFVRDGVRPNPMSANAGPPMLVVWLTAMIGSTLLTSRVVFRFAGARALLAATALTLAWWAFLCAFRALDPGGIWVWFLD